MRNKKLVSFLKQPYPFYFEGKDLFYLCAVLFSMSLFFNYFFKPFNVYVPEQKMDFFWISVIHSTMPVVVIAMASGFLKLKPSITDEWLLWKEFVLIFIILVLTGTGQFLIRDVIYNNPNNWSWAYFLEEVRNTCLVGMLFVAILVPINLNRLLLKNQQKAFSISSEVGNPQTPVMASLLSVKPRQKQDAFQLDANNLIFAKSEGNYVALISLEDGKAVKVLKRITIKELEALLSSVPFITKTHRSYLVNLQKIKKISGNAQGYRLNLNGTDHLVPVSRYLIDAFEERLKSL